MAYATIPKTRLDRLEYSPTENPLTKTAQIKTKSKMVRSGRIEELINAETGEVTHTSMLHELHEVDDAHFVKIFAAGVIAMYDLTATAQKVFSLVLKKYQQSEMTGGYANCVELFWFNDGLDGKKANMSEQTFNRGLRELIDKKFLSARMPHSYWINANLFFKGDRVLFLKEYRKTQKITNKEEQT